MIKQTITFIALFIGLNTIAQIKFEKGYIINNNGEKIDCLIKNEDWLHNPLTFLYKKDNNSKEIIGNLNSIKEFSVNGYSKYKRFKVNIDKSKTNINQLSRKRTYDFVMETLFLKVLIEGKANLYVYDEGDIIKYFYKKENASIHQLEYKEYLNSKNYLAKNKNYLTQLRIDVSCDNVNYKNVIYKKNSLVNYFLTYNNCNGVNNLTKDYTKSVNKNKFNINIKLGVGQSSTTFTNDLFGYSDIESSGINFRAGVEGEYILPFNKNKWSIFVEPTYQTYKSEIEGNQSGEISYSSIELPFGIKYYMFLNDSSKLFISGAYVLDFTMNSEIDFKNIGDLDIETTTSYLIGFGYNYNDKYTLEARFNSGRDLTQNYTYWQTNYTSFSIVLGYNIF
ncbi:MAG: outer membrane beta-barrel protein [Polaribacter sp.]|uniref:outer membrane beta-barrel protein n=1 Tax=Polaribacter sp. TaxID=1920175 RepID=UPI002F35D8AF